MANRAGFQKVTELPLADTLFDGVRAVAPGAGTPLATLTPPAGIYKVVYTAQVGAGALAVDDGNVTARVGATSKAIPTNGAPYVLERVTLDGSTTVRVVSGATPTAGVAYIATVAATRLA